MTAYLLHILRPHYFGQPRERFGFKLDSLSMSFAQSNSNGHLNGGYNRDQIERYDEDLEHGGPAGPSRVRRAGGYGGFLNDSLPLPSGDESAIPLRYGPPDADWDDYQAHEDSNKGARSHMASNMSRSLDRVGRGLSNARVYGSGPGGRQIAGWSQNCYQTYFRVLLPRFHIKNLINLG